MVIEMPNQTIYTDEDAMGSLLDCIRAQCGNPDRLQNPCPAVSHGTLTYPEPRGARWKSDPVTDRQVEMLWILGAAEEFCDEELEGITKGEAADLIEEYQELILETVA